MRSISNSFSTRESSLHIADVSICIVRPGSLILYNRLFIIKSVCSRWTNAWACQDESRSEQNAKCMKFMHRFNNNFNTISLVYYGKFVSRCEVNISNIIVYIQVEDIILSFIIFMGTSTFFITLTAVYYYDI